MWVKTNNEGFVCEFLLSGSTAVIADGVYIDESDVDVEDFKLNNLSYKIVDGKIIKDESVYELIVLENEKKQLRNLREHECFPIINRGSLWYDMLTDSQKEELTIWYRAWLDITKTNIIPEKPVWLE